MLELEKKCSHYINGSIRIGGSLALIDICNRLVAKYHSIFGEEEYQIINTNSGFITLMGVTMIHNEMHIIGREIIFKSEVIIYGKRVYAKVLDEMVIKKACIKMLYAIKSI